jgi:hypothetical protein
LRAHEKYYGEALREVESGTRRDDLWGKAFARGNGDAQKARAIYLDTLARLLEQEAGAPEKAKLLQERTQLVGTLALNAGKGLLSSIAWGFLRIAVCTVIAVILTKGILSGRAVTEATQLGAGILIFVVLAALWIAFTWSRKAK